MSSSSDLTFWEHLDVLRGSLIRCLVAVFGCAIVAFVLKEQIFDLVLWPQKADFPTYRLLDSLSSTFLYPQGVRSLRVDLRLLTTIPLISTGLAQQFIIHMRVALALGALLVSPYILYELIRFVSPALYPNERAAALPAVLAGYVMFLLGLALSYLLIFPFTFRFLGTYQVQAGIANLISLDSYISTLLILSLMMGVFFELPVLCWLLAKLGLLTSAPMRHYRRHAVVAIVILAALITPTGDIFTLSLVSLPIYVLYEAGICLVKRVEKQKKA
ncbi:MAG: twin-arginine translocase subunit TatC [Paludibacteraceae bacterium]|nr:twin-arginine translocase subunit TatC [Paludibacteraceae bacterium]